MCNACVMRKSCYSRLRLRLKFAYLRLRPHLLVLRIARAYVFVHVHVHVDLSILPSDNVVTIKSMELWSAYNCQEASYSGATHVQVGSFRAEKKSVSVKASELSASADGFGEKVRDCRMLLNRTVSKFVSKR